MQLRSSTACRALLGLSSLILSLLPTLGFAAAGDLHVGNLASSVFRITPAGTTTQLVGSFDPYGIAFNARAEEFAASSDGKKIFRIDSSGTATIFATALGDPLGLAFDRNGNLYAADYTAAVIWKFGSDGSKATFASGISHADGLAFDLSDNLFVTRYVEGSVIKVTPSGTKTLFAGGLIGPVGVACDAAGNVFVAERDGGRIVRFSPSGDKSIFSTGVDSPYGLVFDAGGRLFVTDQFTGTIFKLSDNGVPTKFATISGEAGFIAFEPATGVLQNVSTRLRVLPGENVLIGGFIITGSESKRVAIRALGPSLAQFGVPNSLQDPLLELHDKTGAIIRTNDDWKQTQQGELEASNLPPTDDREAAMIETLEPEAYTAIARGKSDSSGVGLVEIYDLAGGPNAKLSNISTRGFVDAGDNVMIGGFIIGGGNGAEVIVRALGPSLADFGIANPLSDPFLALYDANGVLVAMNDNWKDTQQIAIEATAIVPPRDAESAIVIAVAPGPFTAIVSGKGGETGVGLVEVYSLR
jgi:hypothetical protein